MNQVFAASLALIIALVLWGSKKQLKTKSSSNSHTNFYSSHFETSSLINEEKLVKNKTTQNIQSDYSPLQETDLSKNSIEINKKLTQLFSSNPEDRLSAIEIASHWENPKSLKFLKMGLKDFDSRVVIAAAEAISFFKGKTININSKAQKVRPPRNVSLMR